MGDTFKAKRASCTFDQDLQSFYTGFLDKVAPNARKIIDETLEDIEKEAQRNWPKRKAQVRRNKDGKIVFFRDNSKNSWKRFERGYRVDASGNLVGYLRNTAPYAWAIKFGIDSENSNGQDIIFPTGKRVSNELLVRPLRRGSRNVINALADDIMKVQGE